MNQPAIPTNRVDTQLLNAILSQQTAQYQAGDDALIDRVGQRLCAQLLHVDPRALQTEAIQKPEIATPATSSTAITVNELDGKWRQILPGVERKTLMRTGPSDVAVMLRMQSGAILPAHDHAADESCVVVSGRLRIGASLVVGAGGFHWVAQGSAHEPITAEVETLIYLRGAIDAHA